MAFNSLEIADFLTKETNIDLSKGGRLIGRAPSLDQTEGGDFESLLESMLEG